MTRAARTALDDLKRLAWALGNQNRPDAPITITRRQLQELGKALRIKNRPLMWGSHPLRVVDDEL
jgi:hypothetical protein